MANYIIKEPITSMKGAFDVSGKNVIITGGSSGIGRGIAQAFAECGANVCIFARGEKRGLKAVDELRAQFDGRFEYVPCDVASIDSVRAAHDSYFGLFDSVDVLVNDAGVATTAPFLSEVGLDEWHRVIDVDLNGVANMCYVFAPPMRDAGNGGTIINISSVGAMNAKVTPEMHNAPYHSAKAGVDIFSSYLAQVLGDDGINVVSLQPGPIHSELDENLPAEVKEKFFNQMPAHRFGEPIEVGAFCVFLASPAGAFLTGSRLPCDGGLLAIGG